jgi:phosphoribosyl 1,2-cyclic phosphate phosphodiesterase
LHFYASPATLRHAADLLARDCAPHDLLDPRSGDRLNLHFHQVHPYQTFEAGPYRVTTVPANHDPAVEPLLYAIQSPQVTIFYGTDTASLPEETWDAFHRLDLRFDLVVLDHTYGLAEEAPDHLNARQFGEHLARLRAEGLLPPHGRAFATHIAHPGNPPHPELAAYASEHGYEVAYDGLRVTIDRP